MISKVQRQIEANELERDRLYDRRKLVLDSMRSANKSKYDWLCDRLELIDAELSELDKQWDALVAERKAAAVAKFAK